VAIKVAAGYGRVLSMTLRGRALRARWAGAPVESGHVCRRPPAADRVRRRRRSNPPRNLSGKRTARARHLWKAGPGQVAPRRRCRGLSSALDPRRRCKPRRAGWPCSCG